MRIPALLLCPMLLVSSARSEPLSDADREALLDNLEKIRETADSKIDARFRLAIAAYREAMSSDDAAYDFYLKCVEKVNFTDQDKKAADFREWKKKEGDKHSEPGFRLALLYQLRWLVLTLRASSEKTKISDLIGEAQETVDLVFRDVEKLSGQEQALSQSVIATVFARAYDVNATGKNNWPTSPVMIEQIYDAVIFPSLRNSSRIESLRAAWIKRIQQEILKNEHLAGGGGRKNAPRTPDHERFMAETLPELQWQMEMDLFKSGDESGAALRMLRHIEKHLDHRSARKWGDDLKALLTPQPDATAAPAATPGG
jgi:hypothetical protein